MKIIRITKEGNYTSHGIGYTDHDGYAGTCDNRMSQKCAWAVELDRNIQEGETYRLEVNGENRGTHTKGRQE